MRLVLRPALTLTLSILLVLFAAIVTATPAPVSSTGLSLQQEEQHLAACSVRNLLAPSPPVAIPTLKRQGYFYEFGNVLEDTVTKLVCIYSAPIPGSRLA